MFDEVYEWVRATRRGLLDYCGSLPPEVFCASRDDFGHRSLCGTLLHTAGCYDFWLAGTVFGRDTASLEKLAPLGAAAAGELFARAVDPLVDELLGKYRGAAFTDPLQLEVRWLTRPLIVTPLWVFTHVITHEFHHKGQIVALGRVLGYPPPETDLHLPLPPA